MDDQIRPARMEDLPRILALYADARQFMAAHGNPHQWRNTHPPQEVVIRDIQQGKLYVLEDGAGIRGVFYYALETDATYAVIADGSWRKDTPYGVIHRIAGHGGGILAAAVAFAARECAHLRIDTHRDNRVMQRALEKQGFQYRGIIHLASGEPRMAYDRI